MNPFYVGTNDFTAMQSALAVTPNDGTDLVPPTGGARPTRGVLVGGAGNLTCIYADGSTALITIPATACGVIIPISVTRIKSTGTTATLTVAFF